MTLPTKIGYATKIKDLFAMVDSGIVPVLLYKDFVYVIDSTARGRGCIYYTKFTKNAAEALHSVIEPFSYAHTIGELIDRGEGLRDKLPPMIEVIPPLGYTVI